MIRVCYYRGCGFVYGEKEPLSDKRITHGLCPKHFKISLEEIIDEMQENTEGDIKIQDIRSVQPIMKGYLKLPVEGIQRGESNSLEASSYLPLSRVSNC